MSKIVNTNKEINGAKLTFYPKFEQTLSNQDKYTQVNTYLWDSSQSWSRNNETENDEIYINNIQKLVHAVNINWDNPTGCDNLVSLNGGPINTTDDLIYVLEKLANIAINGNSNNSQAINKELTVNTTFDNTDNTTRLKYTLTGLVGGIQNENIEWSIDFNSTYLQFDTNVLVENNIIKGTSVDVKLNTDAYEEANKGSISIPSKITASGNKIYALTPQWTRKNTTENWNKLYNYQNQQVSGTVTAKYKGANDCATELTFHTNYELKERYISIKLNGTNLITNNSGSNNTDSVTTSWGTISIEKTSNNKADNIKIQLSDTTIPVANKNDIISINITGITTLGSELSTSINCTLSELGLPITDVTKNYNAIIFVNNEIIDDTSTLVNNLSAIGFNVYIDTSTQSYTIESEKINEIPSVQLSPATYPSVLYFAIPAGMYNTQRIIIPLGGFPASFKDSDKKLSNYSINGSSFDIYELECAPKNSTIQLSK